MVCKTNDTNKPHLYCIFCLANDTNKTNVYHLFGQTIQLKFIYVFYFTNNTNYTLFVSFDKLKKTNI